MESGALAGCSGMAGMVVKLAALNGGAGRPDAGAGAYPSLLDIALMVPRRSVL